MGFQRWQLPRIEPVELEARFSVNAPALKRQTRAAPDRDGLSFPCGGDNFGGRKFDRAGDPELAEQPVYVAARTHEIEIASCGEVVRQSVLISGAAVSLQKQNQTFLNNA